MHAAAQLLGNVMNASSASALLRIVVSSSHNPNLIGKHSARRPHPHPEAWEASGDAIPAMNTSTLESSPEKGRGLTVSAGVWPAVCSQVLHVRCFKWGMV